MRRKRIAVLMASFEREYQQNFASGLAEASAGYGIDICIFNSRGHMDISMSTSEEQESMIYDLPDPEQFDGIISMPATMGSDTTLQKIYEFIASLKGKPHVSIDVRQENAGRVDGFLAKSAPHRSQRAAFLHWAPYKANTSHQFSYILT